MEPSPETVLQHIRATRAQPPGWAARTTERSEIYGSALEQFQQLLEAARASGAASRPLTLFYALSQAGRAIVAARGEVPAVRGHGLQEVRPEPETPEEDLHLLRRRIRRHAWDNRLKQAPAEDAFGAVSRAIGSPDFEGEVDLGAAWVSAPLSAAPPDDAWRSDWMPYVMVSELKEQSGYETSPIGHRRQAASLMSIVGHPMHRPAETLAGARYPTIDPSSPGLGLFDAHHLEPGLREASWLVIAQGVDVPLLFERNSTAHLYLADRVAIPTLRSTDSAPLKPLMLWWTLLFGLSIFARYEPGLWGQALRIDQSSLAAPIEAVLEQALDHLPAMVYGELIAPPLAAYPG